MPSEPPQQYHAIPCCPPLRPPPSRLCRCLPGCNLPALPIVSDPAWLVYPSPRLLQVLLLDELTTFLDYEDQENVLQCVRRIVDTSRQQPQQQQPAAVEAASSSSSGGGGGGAAQGGVTALWVTHRLEELDYADSVRWGQPLC